MLRRRKRLLGLLRLGRAVLLFLVLLLLFSLVLLNLLGSRSDDPNDLAIAPLVVDDRLDDLAVEVPAAGEDVDVVGHVGEPAAVGVISAP